MSWQSNDNVTGAIMSIMGKHGIELENINKSLKHDNRDGYDDHINSSDDEKKHQYQQET